VVAEPVGHLELQLDKLGRVEAQGILEVPRHTESQHREKERGKEEEEEEEGKKGTRISLMRLLSSLVACALS
jgi:hypothetical protein